MAKKQKPWKPGVVGRRVARMYHAQNGLCGYCGTDKMFLRQDVEHGFYNGNRHLVATFDHVVAKVNGGPNTLANGVCACSRCNTLKSDLSAEEFLERYDELYQRLIERPGRVSAKRQIQKAKNCYIIAWFAEMVGKTVDDIFIEYVYNSIYDLLETLK